MPETMPQTSQGGEFAAALMAAHLSTGVTTLVDDCANVVDSFDGWYDGGEFSAPKVLGACAKPQCAKKTKPLEAQTYGATIRMAKAQLSGRAQMFVVKCKAHVMDDASELQLANLSDEERLIAKGNDLADNHAKAALSLFDPINPSLRGRLDREELHARAAVSVIAKLIPLWPIAKAKKKRAAKTPDTKQLLEGEEDRACAALPGQLEIVQPGFTVDDAERVPMEELHCWVNGPNGWFCNVCRARAGTVMPRIRLRQRCPGLPDLLSASAAASTGHVIAEVRHADGDFSICRECGKWGTRSAKGLREHCVRHPKTRSVMQSWTRVFRKASTLTPGKVRYRMPTVSDRQLIWSPSASYVVPSCGRSATGESREKLNLGSVLCSGCHCPLQSLLVPTTDQLMTTMPFWTVLSIL